MGNAGQRGIGGDRMVAIRSDFTEMLVFHDAGDNLCFCDRHENWLHDEHAHCLDKGQGRWSPCRCERHVPDI